MFLKNIQSLMVRCIVSEANATFTKALEAMGNLKVLTLQQANNKNSKFILLIINETIAHHNNVPHDPVTNNF